MTDQILLILPGCFKKSLRRFELSPDPAMHFIQKAAQPLAAESILAQVGLQADIDAPGQSSPATFTAAREVASIQNCPDAVWGKKGHTPLPRHPGSAYV
jgi:hypothetical protein